MARRVRTCCGSLPVLWILYGIFTLVNAEQVNLTDTTKAASLRWQTYSVSGTTTDSWRETGVQFEGKEVPIYIVCKVGQAGGTNNWLRTPFIPRDGANRMYIEIKFTMRKCQQYENPLKQCYTTFNLLYYQADTDFANAGMPTWDSHSYKHIDTIAGDKIYVSSSESLDDIINTEVRDVPVNKGGLYFAIQDVGACIGIIAIRVYHVRCPEVTINFARFPATPTSADGNSPQRTNGICVNNAAMAQQPVNLCLNSGGWFSNAGRCACMPGFEPRDTTACTPCPVGSYKWETNSDSCQRCPDHSYAHSQSSVECTCNRGYYRAETDSRSRACSQPPSAPRNLTVVAVDQSTVKVSWEPPTSTGGRDDLSYRVECVDCGNTVQYKPRQNSLLELRAQISGLMSGRTYVVQVYAENGVTSISSVRPNFQEKSVTTVHAIPAKVENFRLIDKSSELVTLGWNEPTNKITKEYDVRYYTDGRPKNQTQVLVKENTVTIHQLRPDTKYSFMVRAHTHEGWSEFTAPLTVSTSPSNTATAINPQNGDNPVGIITGAIIAVIVCLAIVVIMVVIFLRRNSRACDDKNPSECDALHYSNGEVPVHLPPPPVDVNGGFTVPLFTPPGAVRTYIDPHTYEDPQQAVREFTKEIDSSLITIESVIGGGEFGDVCKGKFRVPGKGEMTVAIKTLKPGASEKNRLDFLTEASIMGQFDNNNVIYLEGVVTKTNPIMIVTEYMENGSLDAFLRANDGKFTVIQLVGMMRGIACGMRYLSEMGYVHRDLAARNILVNDTLVCKVADFGLSREIEVDTSEGAYTTKGGKIPVRWTAPEAIAYRKFTSASDVWSYGVVMWEVMAYGERPYWNWSNQDVIKAVDKGYRLPPPMDCAEALHQLMLDCWAKERGQRPKFVSIVKTLDKLIRAPELLRKIAKPSAQNILDPSMPDMTMFSSVEEWLISVKMERYIDSFLAADYHSMEQVSRITMKDLISLGITLVGHQKKIMNSVQRLRAQLDGAQVSAGFLV